MQILPHQFDSERGYFGHGGTKEGRQPTKKALTSDGKKGVSMKGGGRERIAELPGVLLSRMTQLFFCCPLYT